MKSLHAPSNYTGQGTIILERHNFHIQVISFHIVILERQYYHIRTILFYIVKHLLITHYHAINHNSISYLLLFFVYFYFLFFISTKVTSYAHTFEQTSPGVLSELRISSKIQNYYIALGTFPLRLR